MKSIPSTIGLLSVSVAAMGCSDAAKFSNTVEKVCKEQCECPDTLGVWNEIGNCRRACEGYAIQFEAFLADQESEPCGNFDRILDDMRACTNLGCGDPRYECLSTAYYEVFECWGVFDYDYANASHATPGELVRQLLQPIPGALPPSQLHAAQ